MAYNIAATIRDETLAMHFQSNSEGQRVFTIVRQRVLVDAGGAAVLDAHGKPIDLGQRTLAKVIDGSDAEAVTITANIEAKLDKWAKGL